MTTLALRFAPPRSAPAAIYLPFTPVPITGQTLGVLLIGAATLGLYLSWG